MTIPEAPPATLRLILDRSALIANWRTLDRLSGSGIAGAAVKADAYGLGVAQVVPALLEAGARNFFVAHWGEVPAVLQHIEGAWINVLHGVNSPEEAAFAKATGVRPVINSLHQAKLWCDAGGGECHLMVDSGMNRLGLPPSQIGDPLIAALDVDILLSHLASADEDTPQNAQQLAIFEEVAKDFPAKRRSLANSAGIALGDRYHFDLTRPGLSLYGGVASEALAGQIAQVAYPQAAVLQLRALSPGDAVGYNATFVAQHAMRVATISLGYADGILRCWGENGALQHDGQGLPVLGRVSMDMVVVDCTSAPDLKEGDFLDFSYDLPSASAASGLSQYELLTLLGKRFSRKMVDQYLP